MEYWTFHSFNKVLNFPRFGKWGIVKCDIIIHFSILLKISNILTGCYNAWRRGASRQAVGSQNSGSSHCQHEAPGGRVEFARRWRNREDSVGAWRLVVWDARQAVWNHVSSSDARGTPSGFGAKLVCEDDLYTALGDVFYVMLWLGAHLRVYLVLG